MGNKVSSADIRVSDCFPAEVFGRDGNFNWDSFSKLAMDEKLPAADSRVGVGRKRDGMPDITKGWQDTLMPKAQGRIVHQQFSAVHHQSRTSIWININHEGLQELSYESVETNYAYSGAGQGIGEEAESLIEGFFSEFKNFDRPFTDGSRELKLEQFLQVFEPETCKMANPNYSNRCLSQLDNILKGARIEYDQGKLQQNKFQQETRGRQATVPERSEIEQLKMTVKDCVDKIRELTGRVDQQQMEFNDKIRELNVRLRQKELDGEECQFEARELRKILDALKEKMDGGKANWSDLALSIANVLALAFSIAVPFFCPRLPHAWLILIKFACSIPWLLSKILPKIWNWVKDFLNKLS